MQLSGRCSKNTGKSAGSKNFVIRYFPAGGGFNNTRVKILQVNQTVRKFHAGEKIIYLPVGHYFLEDDGSISRIIMPDFLHIFPFAYEIRATQIEPTIAALLDDKSKSPDSSD